MPAQKPSDIVGLTAEQITRSLRQNGSNAVQPRDFTFLRLIITTIFSAFNVVMAVLIVILLAIGQKSTGMFLGLVGVVNTIVALIQEIRAKMVIQKLNKLSKRTARVIRQDGGKNGPVELPVTQIVVGDIVFLSTGDRVPVDGEVITAVYAEFDESILTGESKYIHKSPAEELRAGSFIVGGSCYYKVTKLLRDSYIQTLTKEVVSQGERQTPLQGEINQIIKVLTYMTIFFILLIIAEGIINYKDTTEIIINSATLVSTLVPQGLVLITTISFSYGAMRIARNEAVVQKLNAIESMATAKVVCMDKTGTLTTNSQKVKEIKWL